MNGSSQFCFHRDHSRMSKRHQEPALVFRELKPKCCFVLTRFQVSEVQGTEFWKPQAALGFGSSHTDSEEQCLEKCECPLCVGTVTVLSACPWRPLGVTKGPRKLTAYLIRVVHRGSYRGTKPRPPKSACTIRQIQMFTIALSGRIIEISSVGIIFIKD